MTYKDGPRSKRNNLQNAIKVLFNFLSATSAVDLPIKTEHISNAHIQSLLHVIKRLTTFIAERKCHVRSAHELVPNVFSLLIIDGYYVTIVTV